MGTDCNVMSPNARKIFEKLKPFYPPDPWQRPMWDEEGRVKDNGSFDLRKSSDRSRLIERSRSTLGSFVETVAGAYETRVGSFDGLEHHHFGLMIKHEVERLKILNDLDFQIETGDLVDA